MILMFVHNFDFHVICLPSVNHILLPFQTTTERWSGSKMIAHFLLISAHVLFFKVLVEVLEKAEFITSMFSSIPTTRTSSSAELKFGFLTRFPLVAIAKLAVVCERQQGK